MTVDDLCLVDLDGNQVAGARPRSSEILLHLEIMKAVPQATAVLHCHPPHATAYAITGLVPPACIIPEQEVFVGTVALSPYETPGTQGLRRDRAALRPRAQHDPALEPRDRLLGRHRDPRGVVRRGRRHLLPAPWSSRPTSGRRLTKIPADKAAHLLDIKKKLGMPDARFGLQECQLCDQPEFPRRHHGLPARIRRAAGADAGPTTSSSASSRRSPTRSWRPSRRATG